MKGNLELSVRFAYMLHGAHCYFQTPFLTNGFSIFFFFFLLYKYKVIHIYLVKFL